MPNFQKSKGFQLKSGNAAKAPFKMMGSSPAKLGLGSIMSGLANGLSSQKKVAEFGKNQMSKVDASSKVMKDLSSDTDRMKIVSQELKGPSEKTEKVIAKDKKSIKKQAGKVGDKPGTMVGRAAKKAGSWIKDMDKKQEDAFASGKGQRREDQFNKAANILNPKGNYSTDNEAKFKAGKKADQLHDVKMGDVERDRLEKDTQNKRRQQIIDKDNLELSEPTSSALDVNGNPVFTPQSLIRKNFSDLDINEYS